MRGQYYTTTILNMFVKLGLLVICLNCYCVQSNSLWPPKLFGKLKPEDKNAPLPPPSKDAHGNDVNPCIRDGCKYFRPMCEHGLCSDYVSLDSCQWLCRCEPGWHGYLCNERDVPHKNKASMLFKGAQSVASSNNGLWKGAQTVKQIPNPAVIKTTSTPMPTMKSTTTTSTTIAPSASTITDMPSSTTTSKEFTTSTVGVPSGTSTTVPFSTTEVAASSATTVEPVIFTPSVEPTATTTTQTGTASVATYTTSAPAEITTHKRTTIESQMITTESPTRTTGVATVIPVTSASSTADIPTISTTNPSTEIPITSTESTTKSETTAPHPSNSRKDTKKVPVVDAQRLVLNNKPVQPIVGYTSSTIPTTAGATTSEPITATTSTKSHKTSSIPAATSPIPITSSKTTETVTSTNRLPSTTLSSASSIAVVNSLSSAVIAPVHEDVVRSGNIIPVTVPRQRGKSLISSLHRKASKLASKQESMVTETVTSSPKHNSITTTKPIVTTVRTVHHPFFKDIRRILTMFRGTAGNSVREEKVV